MDSKQDRDQQDADRQGKETAVPEIARLPQGSEADSEKQDNYQQAGDGESESVLLNLRRSENSTPSTILNQCCNEGNRKVLDQQHEGGFVSHINCDLF